MEMFGMIGGLAGAGASLAGGIMNAEEAEETRQMNWAIAVMNYQQRQREHDDAVNMALKLRNEQKLGTTDARGTRTHFVPGRGWVVDPSEAVAALQKYQDEEQKKVLLHDLPQLRKQRDANYQQTFPERALAETYRMKLANNFVPDDSAYESLLLRSQTNMLDRASRDAGRRLFTNVGRTGGNMRAYQETARTLAQTANDAYADAGLKAKMLSQGMGQREADTRDKGLANLYNMFATRASQMPNISYKPQNLDDAGTLASAQQGLLSTGNLATGAFGKKGGELDYLSPNMGWGNAVAGAGSALASAFRGMGASGGGKVTGFGGSGGGDADIYTGTEGDWVQV